MDNDKKGPSRNIPASHRSRLPILTEFNEEGSSGDGARRTRKIRFNVIPADTKIPVHNRTLESLRQRIVTSPAHPLRVMTSSLPRHHQGRRKSDTGGAAQRRKIGNFHIKSKNLIKITGRELVRFPMEIFELSEIENLVLSPEREACLNFKLHRLPPEIGRMLNLKTLVLDTNDLQDLPIEINRLQNLEILVLSNNSLETLPDQFRQLSSLTDLHLANNKFSDFPNEICHLPSLKFLDMSDNRLESLASEIWLLSATLVTLLLVYNQLTKLPITFSSLSSLKTLWLGHNNLKSLPEDFGDLQHLEWNLEPCSANIDHNPLERPPLGVCQQGSRAIKRYFEELEIEEKLKRSKKRKPKK